MSLAVVVDDDDDKAYSNISNEKCTRNATVWHMNGMKMEPQLFPVI